MRRMTIFRSELAGAALLAALTTVAAAQQPPAIQRPIQQAQQAADAAGRSAQQSAQPQEAQPAPGQRVTITSGGQDATQALTQGQATPATHTVREGDTLWALAQQYLGDPMLWPEIYRLNTMVVEDPHWIYPGEELRISPEAGGTVQPSADTAVVAQDLTVTPTATDTQPAQQQQEMAPAPTTGPTIFSTMGAARPTPTLQGAGTRAYRAVREGEYYSAGFLTENQPLPSGQIVANAATSNRGTIRTRTSAQLNEEVIVSAPAGQQLAAGGLLLSYERTREVAPYGEVVRPTGLLRVKRAAASPYWVAEVFRMFQPINDGQEIIAVQPFVNSSSVRAEPVSNGITGDVIVSRDNNEVSQLQDILFIDKGANQGLKLGDIVQLFMVRGDTTTGTTVEQDQGRAIIVNTRSNTATALIVELYRSDVGPWSKFRQVRRMPS